MSDTDRIEPLSSTWRFIKGWAEKELREAQGVLEQTGLGDGPTEFERGRVRALRQLLRLSEPRPVIPPQSD